MITIEKAYYSENTNQIHLHLYNSNPEIGSFSELISAIQLFKSASKSDEFRYTCTWNLAEFDESLDNNNYQCHIFINIDDITPAVVDYPVFSSSGVTRVEISTIGGSYSLLIVDQKEFYPYKMNIINGEICSDCDIKYSKKLSRFSFYERMLVEAADSGYIYDAELLYNELKKMSEYGLPTVKRISAS